MSAINLSQNIDLAAFHKMEGEQFGGGKNFVDLEIGQVAGPFVHVKVEKGVRLSEDSEPIPNMYIARNPDGLEVRMPASAVFRANADEAKLRAGDEYYIARDQDREKKKGKGKGRKMSVYLIKVTKRMKK